MTPEGLRAAAAKMPGETHEEQWAAFVESKLVAAGEPAFSPWWRSARAEFWRSGKTVEVACKANRAGGTHHTVLMCAVPQCIFRERKAVADTQLAWANSSATLALANDSIALFKTGLRALGFREVKSRSKDEVKRISSGEFFARDGSTAMPGSVEFLDLAGNRCEYRSSVASKAGLSGFTGIGFTADEIGLWKGEAEKPGDVLELGLSRLKGQRDARAHLISRSFTATDHLHRMALRGSNEALFVQRLGEGGARDDEYARRSLREYLIARAAQGDRAAKLFADDPRLDEDADPSSPIIPAWAALQIGDGAYGPAAAILACWRLAAAGVGLDDGEVPLDGLFRVYGGRPDGQEGGRYFSAKAIDVARRVIL